MLDRLFTPRRYLPLCALTAITPVSHPPARSFVQRKKQGFSSSGGLELVFERPLSQPGLKARKKWRDSTHDFQQVCRDPHASWITANPPDGGGLTGGARSRTSDKRPERKGERVWVSSAENRWPESRSDSTPQRLQSLCTGRAVTSWGHNRSWLTVCYYPFTAPVREDKIWCTDLCTCEDMFSHPIADVMAGLMRRVMLFNIYSVTKII